MKLVAALIFFFALSVASFVPANAAVDSGDSTTFTGNESFRKNLLGLDPYAYDRLIGPFVTDPFQSLHAGQFQFGIEPYSKLISHQHLSLDLDTNLGVSEINLVMGSKREQLLFLDHRQRIAKHMHGRLSYNSIVSPGFLLNSLGRYQSLLSGFDYSNGPFKSSLDFQYDRLSIDENGGILPGQVIDGLSLSEYEQIKTRLPDDKRQVRDWKLDFKNEIALFKFRDSIARLNNNGLFFGLDAGWRRYGTSYIGIVDSSFYPVVYKDSVNTIDSSGYILLRLAPSVSFRFIRSSSSFRIGAGWAWVDVSTIQDSVRGSGAYSNPFLAFSGNLGRLDFNLQYESVLGDWYNQGDFSWKADWKFIGKGGFFSGWSGFVQQRQLAPALLLSNYSSNQFRWSYDFRKEKYMKVFGRLDFWKGKGAAYFDVERAENWVYLNDAALPVQSKEDVSLLKSGLQLNSEWRRWRFSCSVIHAVKSGEQLRYPEWSGWSRIAYKAAFFKKALKAEVGCTAYGTQSYDAMAFMPITGLNFVQSGFNSGGAPVVDFFFHAGIGKATLSLVVQRINDGLFGGDYYLAPGYPAPPRTLKFVLRWRLYN